MNVNRRNFIKAATAGAGGLATRSVFGQGDTGGGKPLRVALIGCGLQGIGVHIPALCKERLVALVDPDTRQIAKALQRVRQMSPATDTAAIRTFGDYRKFFDEMGKELDAVFIATPNHQHALPALLAIRLGIHVYVEKPLAHTIAEARQITAEARKANLKRAQENYEFVNLELQRIAAKRDEALTASREEAMEPLPAEIADAAVAETVEG